MATLNGVEFGIVNKTTTVIHDNNVIDIPGSDTVVNDDAGYSTGPMQITGHVKNESEFDDFKGEFYGGGDLTLIADPDSGKQYTVYASGNVTELDGDNTYPLIDIVFQCSFFMKYPYLESTTDVTRTKTITSNNQEWSADDDGADIETYGRVDAVPDIQITGGVDSVYEILSPNPISEPGFETITDWSYSESDPYNSLVGGQDSTYKVEGTYSYGIIVSNQLAIGNYGRITQNIDLGLINRITFKHRCITLIGHPIVKFKVLAGSTVIASYDTPADYTDTGWLDRTVDIDSTEQTLSFQIYSDGGAALNLDINTYIDSIVSHKKSPTKDLVIYNTSDTTVKCAVANEVLDGATHRINVDGTGTIDFDDDFSTGKWSYTCAGLIGVTHDTTNDEIDIADDGYIYWKCDAKYPISGVPILTSQINITTGTPTIQISSDGSTWYDIDTAIVDNVDTEYPLYSDGNLSLAGETLFYFRFDCVKAATATCSIKSFELDVAIHTIYAKNPIINKGATASTFRCDQNADSSMNCEVKLIYPARWWA